MVDVQPKMILGTDGGYDYAVFARKGNIVLGVKPLVFMPSSTETTQFVVRFRSCYDEAPRHASAAALREAWSTPFTKSDPVRASLVRAFDVPLALDPQNMAGLVEKVADGPAGAAVVTWLNTVADDSAERLLTDDDMASWINGRFADLAHGIIAQAGMEMQAGNDVVQESGSPSAMGMMFASAGDDPNDTGDGDAEAHEPDDKDAGEDTTGDD